MPEWSIGELSKLADVTPRTIRYYIELGILPPPRGGGRTSVYGPQHLDRLNLIKRLQAARLSLDEIRAELASLPAEAASRLAASPEPPGDSAAAYLAALRKDLSPMASSAPDSPGANYGTPARGQLREAERGESYVAEPWIRIPLTEDVELHVRRRGSRNDSRVARLIDEARRILREDERR